MDIDYRLWLQELSQIELDRQQWEWMQGDEQSDEDEVELPPPADGEEEF